MAPLGYVLSPSLLDLVNAAPEVKIEALPFLRIMFLFSTGMLIFFMLGGALRSAGDARTPMILGIAMTVLNLVLNVILIRGLGPIPSFGTAGSAMGTVIASGLVAVYSLWKLWGGGWVVSIPRGTRGNGFGPDWSVIRSLFRFGLPTGIQGIAMNIGGVFMLAFIGSLAQSAAAQAAFAISYSQLFSLVTWTSVGLMAAAAAVAGQNLGAGRPDRANAAVHVAARFGFAGAAFIGLVFLFFPRQLRHARPCRRRNRCPTSACAKCLGSLYRCRAHVYRRTAGDRRHEEPALHLDHLADRRASEYLLCNSADEYAGADPYLDRDSCWSHDAVSAECDSIQAGKVA
jgi:Na+-driven multidrug efflux pump